MAAKKKATKKIKKGYTTCPDCQGQYKIGMPHSAFCPTHVCSECGDSYGYALPVWDSRENPPIRLCDNCTQDRLDAEEDEIDGYSDEYIGEGDADD